MRGKGAARAGGLYALAAYGLWGLFPLYFKAVATVPAVEVLAHRILWTLAVIAVALGLGSGSGARLGRILASRRLAATLALSALALAVNWGTFVSAVAAGRVLECSLGYFINPLVTVLLAVVVLGERLRRRQWLAVALAALGVGYLIAATGVPPWIGFVLAVSFGLYGLLRKLAPVDPLTGLLVETLVLAPLALAYLGWLAASGDGAFGRGDEALHLLLMAGGPLTALPLVLFAAGARRIRLATLGLLQYVAPTGQFLLAVFVYGEPLTPHHAIAFAGIWAGLAVYSWDLVLAAKEAGV